MRDTDYDRQHKHIGPGPLNTPESKEIEALLEWYKAMGVDEAIGETPVDAFAEMLAPAPLAARIETSPPSPAPLAHPAGGEMLARSLAREANSLAELEALLASFDGCALKRTAKSLCFARGSDRARIMFIGEAPGRDEDLQGLPFVGRAGKLLDRMLTAIGLSESQVYITNTIYWRPPGNRTPTPEEIEACAPFLARQIALLSPKVLVLLGGAAAKNLLGVSEGIMRLRGKWLRYASGAGEIATIATLHPAYLLRNPAAKRYAWRDLIAISVALKSET